MSVENFKPEIWSRELLISLKEALVAENLVNRNYQGDITEQGDTVHINTPSAIPVTDYDGSDFTFDEITSTQQTLNIDQAKKFHFQVRDIDQVQSNVDLIQPYTNEAAFGLADALDEFVLSDAAANAGIAPLNGFDETNAWDQLTEAAQRLNEANVPSQGRWVVVDPFGIKALSQDPAFQRASELGDETSRMGFSGMAAGFNVFMSNNLPAGTYVYSYSGAYTLAEQLLEISSGEREMNFGDFVKGLHVYGGLATRPDAIGTITGAS